MRLSLFDVSSFVFTLALLGKVQGSDDAITQTAAAATLTDSILSLPDCIAGPDVPSSILLPLSESSSVVESFTCFGIDYVVAQPPVVSGCTADAPCGFIIDTHGYSLDAQTQALNDNSIEYGLSKNFVMALPTAPTLDGLNQTNWRPNVDHENLEQFVKAMASFDQIDNRRVHAMGFSQGAFATWSLLCRASETICSIAPLGATGLDDWTADAPGYGTTCFDAGTGPAVKRSILFATGTFDPLSLIQNAKRQVDLVLEDYYDLDGDELTYSITTGSDYEIATYFNKNDIITNPLTFTRVYFDSQGTLYDDIGGHCYPTSPDDYPTSCEASFESFDLSQDGSGVFNHRCCSTWGTWGVQAIDFLDSHPCAEEKEDVESVDPAEPGTSSAATTAVRGATFTMLVGTILLPLVL